MLLFMLCKKNPLIFLLVMCRICFVAVFVFRQWFDAENLCRSSHFFCRCACYYCQYAVLSSCWVRITRSVSSLSHFVSLLCVLTCRPDSITSSDVCRLVVCSRVGHWLEPSVDWMGLNWVRIFWELLIGSDWIGGMTVTLCLISNHCSTVSASEMTFIVSGGALNSTHSL